MDTKRWVFPVRIGYLLEGKDFPALDPDQEGTQAQEATDLLEIAGEFDRLHGEALGWFDRMTTQDLSRQASHAKLGVVTLEELLHEWAAHDLIHTVQAERALMQPLIAGSGPWKPYFTDHWAGS